jgi:hypothetical protein
MLEHAHANALYALALDLLCIIKNLPAGAYDIRECYLLLGLHEHHKMDTMTYEAFQKFSDLYH